jgi:hypothetical protein
VTSDDRTNTLTVFKLPPPGGDTFDELHVLGAATDGPMRFLFCGLSGRLAFTVDSHPLLLVTDLGHAAVHIVDVAAREHRGYVAPPGSIRNPCGVATAGPMAAVSTCSGLMGASAHELQFFACGTTGWIPTRKMGDDVPRSFRGLRFTADGLGVAVTSPVLNRVYLYAFVDGRLSDTCLADGVEEACDLEEWEGGWLVVCRRSGTVVAVGRDGVTRGTIKPPGGSTFRTPAALALAPGLGLLVRESAPDGRVHIVPVDVIATAMSGSGSGGGGSGTCPAAPAPASFPAPFPCPSTIGSGVGSAFAGAGDGTDAGVVGTAGPSPMELLPCWETPCAPGNGLAASATLGVLVVSDSRGMLTVFALPAGAGVGAPSPPFPPGFRQLYVLGGPGSSPPMKFGFTAKHSMSAWLSGCMAFTTGPAPLLLVTDAGQDVVHVIDVRAKEHRGYVGSAKLAVKPHAVASWGSLVAVSCCDETSRHGVVHLFESSPGAPSSWSPLRVISAHGKKWQPRGMRFVADGTRLVVADASNRATVISAADGSFISGIGSKRILGPSDVEEWEGGWLVSYSIGWIVTFVGTTSREMQLAFKCPTALAAVPGLGVVVRERKGCLKVLVPAPGSLPVAAAPPTLPIPTQPLPGVAEIAAWGHFPPLTTPCGSGFGLAASPGPTRTLSATRAADVAPTPPSLPGHDVLGTWDLMPHWTTPCAKGYGLAASPELGVVVTSDFVANTLSVFRCSPLGPGGLSHLRTFGAGIPAPPGGSDMLFCFNDGRGYSGWVAFTRPEPGGTSPPLLVVTDAGRNAVHVIDVVLEQHKGFVVSPGTLLGPRSVATAPGRVAVSFWEAPDGSGHSTVRLFGGSCDSAWGLLRETAVHMLPDTKLGFLNPSGLRFTADGSGLVVCEHLQDRVTRFDVGTFDALVSDVMKSPTDLEECEGGWVVASAFGVEFMKPKQGSTPELVKTAWGKGREISLPTALAVLPGVGLIVRDSGDLQLKVFGPPPPKRASASPALAPLGPPPPPSAPVLPPTGAWLFTDNGRWYPVDAVAAAELSLARAVGEPTCSFKRGRVTYTVDMGTLAQRNCDTGFVRKLKWEPNMVVGAGAGAGPGGAGAGVGVGVGVGSSPPSPSPAQPPSITHVPLVPREDWTPGCDVVDVVEGSAEWAAVVGRVHDSLPDACVSRIERSQVRRVVCVVPPISWYPLYVCACACRL